ncbi:MAG: hypothetical protein ACKOYM_07325, partial [Actinomycetes bacterium]
AALLGAASVAVLVGIFGRLSPGAPTVIGVPAVAAGVALLAVALWRGSQRSPRTVFGRDPWSWSEWMVAGSGVLCAVVVSRLDDAVRQPMVTPFMWPEVSVGVLLAVGAALLPSVAAPYPPGGREHPGGPRGAVGASDHRPGHVAIEVTP